MEFLSSVAWSFAELREAAARTGAVVLRANRAGPAIVVGGARPRAEGWGVCGVVDGAERRRPAGRVGALSAADGAEPTDAELVAQLALAGAADRAGAGVGSWRCGVRPFV